MSDEAQIVKKLSGHSGCEVELWEAKSAYFVRKISPGKAYNPRLIRQAEKQLRLSKHIPLPVILSTKFDDVMASYEMEFVHGLDFKSVCLTSPISWIGRFVEQIFDHFKSLEKVAVNSNLSPLFQQKIFSLQEVLFNHEAPEVRSLFPLLELLADYDYSDLPATENHGDMTLENIIFQTNGEIVFIDVLDGELESIWMDIAKLTYDLEIFWSLRSMLWQPRHSIDERLLIMLSRYLSEEVAIATRRHFPASIPHLPVLKAIQAFRVLPYSHNAETIEKLTNYLRNLPI